MAGKIAEVATLRSIGGPGIVQTQLMEKHQITHTGEDTRFRVIVSGRGDKEDLGPFAVEGWLDPDSGDILDVVAEEIDRFLHGLGLHADMIPHVMTLGNG